jgi:peptide/nickel transport system substrate-binding protein
MLSKAKVSYRAAKATSLMVVGLLLGMSNGAQAETVLRAGMTLGDIPDWTGQPDQGYEGARFVAWSLYDSLINWDLSRSDVEASMAPGLATEWSVDPEDNKRWLFTLRQGVKFHDGCDWNAEAALWNIERLTVESAPHFNPVHFARQRSRTGNLDHAEVVDEYTLAIYSKTPDALFPYNFYNWFQISPCVVEELDYDYAEYAKQPSGTGPYKFDSVVPHERLELIKNTDYWDQARVPKHDRLVLLPMPEATTRTAALLSGEADFIEAPAPDMVDRLKGAGAQIYTNEYPHLWGYMFNTQKGVFADVRVRQAANYAINRDEIVLLLNGLAVPAGSTFSESSPFFGEAAPYGYDLEKAKALLTEAGCDPCEVRIAMPTSGSGMMQPQVMNELVKAHLELAGFTVRLDVVDWSTLTSIANNSWEENPEYDLVNTANPIIDPVSAIFRRYTTEASAPNGLNWGWYSNPEVDALAAEARGAFDVTQQNQLISQMHRLTTEDPPVLFVVRDLNPRALGANLSGFVQAQSWFQDLTPITVE